MTGAKQEASLPTCPPPSTCGGDSASVKESQIVAAKTLYLGTSLMTLKYGNAQRMSIANAVASAGCMAESAPSTLTQSPLCTFVSVLSGRTSAREGSENRSKAFRLSHTNVQLLRLSGSEA